MFAHVLKGNHSSVLGSKGQGRSEEVCVKHHLHDLRRVCQVGCAGLGVKEAHGFVDYLRVEFSTHLSVYLFCKSTVLSVSTLRGSPRAPDRRHRP